MAAAHFLFTSGLVESNVIEFLTLSGILTAKRVPAANGHVKLNGSKFSNVVAKEGFSIELDLPATSVIECDPTEIPSIPRTLNGASMINIKKTASCGDLLVELSSGQTVADLEPQFDEIRKCAGRGVLLTGAAPRGSGFDFYSRLFCPKLGVNEASPRGGMLEVHLNEENQRVQIRGKAVTVMEGSLFA
ncbi:Phenazine biosynthesis PhzF protein [Macleaya cordata]|uniref:Phenazine biosynthesis PhzF protein n=1 Tax=Macleaya cordata TaxID=56857 RepID=A0A200Q4Z3_MACCD|nr:Phenazine biosynthesis PhzF protein [Macleaya cordata]